MKPTLYYDDISPPVRSVLMLINELKIDVNLQHIDLFKGEHRSDEFFGVSRSTTYCPVHEHEQRKHNLSGIVY